MASKTSLDIGTEGTLGIFRILDDTVWVMTFATRCEGEAGPGVSRTSEGLLVVGWSVS